MAKSTKSKQRRLANDQRRAAQPRLQQHKSKLKLQKPPAASNPACYLLRLPRELRDATFDLGDLLPKRRMIQVFRDRHFVPDEDDVSEDSDDSDRDPEIEAMKEAMRRLPRQMSPEVKIDLFQVCRQLRAEALEFLCDNNAFNFQFCPGAGKKAQRDGFHKPHDAMILLQPHFIEFLELIRYMRIDICQEGVDFCGTRLTKHLARHAHRLEKLTIWSCEFDEDGFEDGRPAVLFLKHLADIKSLKVIRISQNYTDIEFIARKLAGHVGCRVEYVCDGGGHREGECRDLPESRKENFPCVGGPPHVDKTTREEQNGYQVMACELMPTYLYLTYHVKLAFEAGVEVGGQNTESQAGEMDI